MSYDITKEYVADTAVLELDRADGTPMVDGEGNRLSITIHGPSSPLFAQAEAEKKRRMRSRVEKAKGNIMAGLDETDEDANHFLATITASFNGWEFPCPDGKWKSKQEEYKAAYSERQLGFVRNQVLAFHNDWGNFAKGSGKA
jgi:hypothetical protein